MKRVSCYTLVMLVGCYSGAGIPGRNNIGVYSRPHYHIIINCSRNGTEITKFYTFYKSYEIFTPQKFEAIQYLFDYYLLYPLSLVKNEKQKLFGRCLRKWRLPDKRGNSISLKGVMMGTLLPLLIMGHQRVE